jgi:Skp family chaperone for outer membrane proteins
MRHFMRRVLLLLSLWGILIGGVGCSSGRFAMGRKPNGLAIVDLDIVAKRLGREDEIESSSTDFQEKIRPVAEKIAKERGLKSVVAKDNPNVLVSASDADITDAVVARFKKLEAAKEKAASPESKEEQAAEQDRADNSWKNAL